MNCDDCIERLDPYVDRELTTEEVEEVSMHLLDCPPCERTFERRNDLKRLVKTCLDAETGASSDLRSRLQHLLA
jgi:anti-sigma factor (TIGR02949 family)